MEYAKMIEELLAGKPHAHDLFNELIKRGAFSREIQMVAASFRQSIFSMVSLTSSLYASLQQAEMYDEIGKLNLQVRSCYKMLNTIMNITELSRYGDGGYTPQFVELGAVLRDLCGITNSLIRSTGKKINLSVPQAPVVISVDPDRFVIAVLNLITNALEFTGEDAKIILSAELVGNDVAVKIADNGIGIPPEHIGRVTEPFYSYSPDSVQQQKLGLGLAIADEFAQQAGGSLFVSGVENQGTSVTIKLNVCNHEPEVVCSHTADYITNRFSPVHIALSNVCKMNFY